MFSWVRLWAHAGVLFGVWAKAQVWAIIFHLDNITQVPWAQQGVGQTKPEHAVPKLALRCNILPPLCCHETTHASKNSSHLLYFSFFTLIPLSRCDVKLLGHSVQSSQLFARGNFTNVISEVTSFTSILAKFLQSIQKKKLSNKIYDYCLVSGNKFVSY